MIHERVVYFSLLEITVFLFRTSLQNHHYIQRSEAKKFWFCVLGFRGLELVTFKILKGKITIKSLRVGDTESTRLTLKTLLFELK